MTHRNFVISTEIVEHPGLPTPWAGGCHITTPQGRVTGRIPLPVNAAFLADLDSARRASLAHGKWLVDQHLDHGRSLP
jgi:hypothetical protein